MECIKHDSKNLLMIKNKGGRPSKVTKYAKERNDVLQKLFDILNIKEKNRLFFWDDVDKDTIKQQQIINLIDDVKKYFISWNWNYFNKNKNISKPYISLAKSIMKDMNVPLISIRLVDNKNGKTIKRGYIIS